MLLGEVGREEDVEVGGAEGHPGVVHGDVAVVAELLGGEADPGRGAVGFRFAERHVAQRVLPHVVDAPVLELGEAVVPLLEGDGGGKERGAGLVPEGEGEDGGLGGVGMEPAIAAIAGGDGGEDDGDVGKREGDRGIDAKIKGVALGGPKADAHDLEVESPRRAGANREGAGIGGQGAGTGR